MPCNTCVTTYCDRYLVTAIRPVFWSFLFHFILCLYIDFTYIIAMRFGICMDYPLEISWLQRIFPDTEFQAWSPQVARRSIELYNKNGTTPIIIRIDKNCLKFVKLTIQFQKLNIPFEIIHLSDEYGADDLSWYELPNLTRIYRNYIYPRSPNEFPAKVRDKIYVFPLGPLVFNTGTDTGTGTDALPPISSRPLMWSFAGRKAVTTREFTIDAFRKFQPHELHLYEHFMDGGKKTQQEYIDTLIKSKCIPILSGSNLETFRLWEALEFGAIPIYLRYDDGAHKDTEYFNFLRKLLPDLKDTTTPDSIFELSTDEMEQYRQSLMKSWQTAKKAPFVPLLEIL